MEGSAYSRLKPYLASDKIVNSQSGEIPTCPISVFTKGMHANSYFFGHPEWGKEYFETAHRSKPFKERWNAVMGSWDDKIIVDIGCGPGNVYATVGGSPKLLIGVDISVGALKIAREVGYAPILADAHHLPFVNGFADIVVANATIHHCDDMGRILTFDSLYIVYLGTSILFLMRKDTRVGKLRFTTKDRGMVSHQKFTIRLWNH